MTGIHGPTMLWMLPISTCSLLLWFGIVQGTGRQQPNIVFIMADDLGYNDVGYHRSHIRTPEIDKLSKEGVRLENYYVQPICTPTRSVFLSGRYQIHTGLQHGVIGPSQAMALPLGSATIADKLREVGYSTYAVGKWHLGFHHRKYLPTRRGFDRFYGFYTGAGDYFKHNRCLRGGCGIDLHDDTSESFLNVYNESGTYSTHLYTNKVRDWIQAHPSNRPFFLYLAYQAVHGPLQVPLNYKQDYLHVADPDRRSFSAMTSAMDEGVGKVVQALKDKGVWNNTILVFSTDNGGDPMNGGSNWPFRGRKGEWFEGGVRAVGFVASPLLEKKKYVNKSLIHVADWFPTLIKLANGNLSGTRDIAGTDQWEVISRNAHSKKITILHGIDPLTKSNSPAGKYSRIFDVRMSAALRIGDYKLITGPCAERKCKRRVNKPNKFMIKRNWKRKTFYKKRKDRRRQKRKQPVHKRAQKDKIQYQQPTASLVQLYNIRRDPLEKRDLSRKLPSIVRKMLDKLQEYYLTSVPPCYPANEKVSPIRRAWGPWKDGSSSEEACLSLTTTPLMFNSKYRLS